MRSQVALVQQDLVLFSGTIEENIRIGKEDAVQWEIEDAAERADALPFIAEFP